MNERPNGELPPNTQVNPKDRDARKIHINAINTPTKEISSSASIEKSDDLYIVQVQKKVTTLREYRPKIPFPERLKQVESQLRKEVNATKEYNLKMEEKKVKALKQDERE